MRQLTEIVRQHDGDGHELTQPVECGKASLADHEVAIRRRVVVQRVIRRSSDVTHQGP